MIVQLGGQTPLGLARAAQGGRACRSSAPRRSRSTWPRSAARSARCWPRPGCGRPAHGTATSYDEAKAIADEIGYPVLVRPSYVLGGRGMEIVYDDATLRDYIGRATDISPGAPGAGRPVPRRRDRDRRGRAVRRDRRGLPRRRHGAHRGGRHPLRRLGLRAAADHAGRARTSSRCAATPRRSPAASACAACSTCSTRSRTTRSTCWRPTRARRGPCRSSPRRPRCRWPRRRPGSCSARRSPSCAPRACCRPTGDGGQLPAGRADRGQGGGAAVQAVPHAGRARASTSCSARR